MVKGVSKITKSFELLAATGVDLPTPSPGPHSYTRALIDSMKEMLKKEDRKPFDTFSLNQLIRRKTGWNTKPNLIDRLDGTEARHISLAPLHKPRSQPTELLKRSAAHLDLRFVLADRSDLTDNEVETVATNVSNAAKKSNMGISAIDWIALDSPRLRDTLKA